jgi:hypothetical protein
VRESSFGRPLGEFSEEEKSSATERGKHLGAERKKKVALTFLTQNRTGFSARDDKRDPLGCCAVDDGNVCVRDMDVFALNPGGLSATQATFESASMAEKSGLARHSSLQLEERSLVLSWIL